jgi:endonuclease/exonuclease/phosphatase family metal-dependent hydrolase
MTGGGAAPLRVLSYDVRGLRGDAAAVVGVIKATRPGVVLLQQAPTSTRWRARCAALAREADLVVVGGDRSAAGNLVLADMRVKVLGVISTALPGRWRRRAGMVLAVVEVGGSRAVVISTRLALDTTYRSRQADALISRIGGLGDQVVCGIGINDDPGTYAWNTLATRLRDAHAIVPRGGGTTFPAFAPTRRIDAIFVSEAVTVLGAGVPSGLPAAAAASDHLPVLAELLLGPSGGPAV